MTRLWDLPKPVRSGLVTVDVIRRTPQRVLVMQFNPDTSQRGLAPQAAGADQEETRMQRRTL